MFLYMAALASAATPDAVIGRWKAPERNAVVEIARCGTQLCGALVDSDGLRANPALRDVNNRDPAQRARPVKGLRMLWGFAWSGSAWTGGSIYNAGDGGTYHGTVTLADPDHLRLKGCVVWPLCKTQTWTRLR